MPYRYGKQLAYDVFDTRADDIAVIPMASMFSANNEQAKANAHLIAAAPELLEYCKMLQEDCETMVEDPTYGEAWDWDLTARNLRNVIANAEGKNAPHSEK
jgi:hypothetical protein